MPVRFVLLLILLAGLLLGVSACGSAPPGSKTMSFANMQAINPGVDGEWILSEYPFARNVKRRADGSIESMGYWIDDPQGKQRPLMLHFDPSSTLVRKQYGGPVVRPPDEPQNNFKIGG